MYEHYERDLEKAQAALITRRETAAEAGLSAYEGVQELNFGGYFGLNTEYGAEEGPAWTKYGLAVEKLEMAESKLKVAESDNLGDTVERVTWIRLFHEEAEAAQIRLNAVPEYRFEDWDTGGNTTSKKE